VSAVGLNFRDVLNVLGMYPGDPGPPGESHIPHKVSHATSITGGSAIQLLNSGCCCSTMPRHQSRTLRMQDVCNLQSLRALLRWIRRVRLLRRPSGWCHHAQWHRYKCAWITSARPLSRLPCNRHHRLLHNICESAICAILAAPSCKFCSDIKHAHGAYSELCSKLGVSGVNVHKVISCARAEGVQYCPLVDRNHQGSPWTLAGAAAACSLPCARRCGANGVHHRRHGPVGLRRSCM